MVLSNSEKETKAFASEIAKQSKDGLIVSLIGNLGSGKTTFTKGLAETLGIKEFSIKSPTYTYIRKHNINGQNFYHIDLYRLEKVDPLLIEELEEIFENKKNIVVIEWADKIQSPLPPHLELRFEYIDTNTRKIEIGND